MKPAIVESLMRAGNQGQPIGRVSNIREEDGGIAFELQIPHEPVRPGAIQARSYARLGNHATTDALLALMTETLRLNHEGHQIEGLEIRDGKPLITLYASPRLAAMAEAGDGAFYIAHGLAHGQRRKTGELTGREVRVQWLETE